MLLFLPKQWGSRCPLGDLVARSGMETALPQIRPQVIPDNGRADYHIVVSGGDFSGISLQTIDDSTWRDPLMIKQKDGFVSISLLTQMTDNFGRKTSILMGVKGISKPNKRQTYQLIADMFPNLKFTPFEIDPSYEERAKLAAQNTIPHQPINFDN